MPEITLQPDATAGLDSYLRENAATTNYGTSTIMQVYYDTSGNNRDAIMKFDLSSIAPGSNIQVATLSLNVQGFISLALRANLYRILPANSGWSESTVTWNTIDGSTAWAGAAGCETAGTDYSASPLYVMGSDFVNGWNDFSLEVPEFQALFDSGNHGMILKGQVRNPAISRGVDITSSDHGTAANRPKLFVRWIDPEGQLHEYTFNLWSGDGKIRDKNGGVVHPSDIRENTWTFIPDMGIVSGEVFTSLVKDPRFSYAVGVDYNDDREEVSMKSNRNQFADQIIRRLSGAI